MEYTNIIKNGHELDLLCQSVRAFVEKGAYEECIELICNAMQMYPHAPQPHNLMGIVLEKMGDHHNAMRHFKAAWALEPTYLPANHNLNTFGTFFSNGRCAFDESDVVEEKRPDMQVEYDLQGIGRIVNKIKIEYDNNGIGRAVRR